MTGGMHWVISFVGCIGVLIKNSGLLSWLKSALGGEEKMLTGKKFSMNFRTLCFAMLELFRDYVGEMKAFQDLGNFLDACSLENMLSKNWVDILIWPVILIKMYVRAECEGNISLHLHACHKMMPYFFATGLVNYARYGICYLRTVNKLPGIVLEQFIKD